jgi:hypothetical protein
LVTAQDDHQVVDHARLVQFHDPCSASQGDLTTPTAPSIRLRVATTAFAR